MTKKTLAASHWAVLIWVKFGLGDGGRTRVKERTRAFRPSRSILARIVIHLGLSRKRYFVLASVASPADLTLTCSCRQDSLTTARQAARPAGRCHVSRLIIASQRYDL